MLSFNSRHLFKIAFFSGIVIRNSPIFAIFEFPVFYNPFLCTARIANVAILYLIPAIFTRPHFYHRFSYPFSTHAACTVKMPLLSNRLTQAETARTATAIIETLSFGITLHQQFFTFLIYLIAMAYRISSATK